MRTKERLIEVLLSVNSDAPGILLFDVECLGYAAYFLQSGKKSSITAQLMRVIMTDGATTSPHIRELAAEALHYLTEAAHG